MATDAAGSFLCTLPHLDGQVLFFQMARCGAHNLCWLKALVSRLSKHARTNLRKNHITTVVYKLTGVGQVLLYVHTHLGVAAICELARNSQYNILPHIFFLQELYSCSGEFGELEVFLSLAKNIEWHGTRKISVHDIFFENFIQR